MSEQSKSWWDSPAGRISAGVLVAVVAALVIASVSQGLSLRATNAVTNERLDQLRKTLEKQTGQLEDLKEATRDRWTRTDQSAHEARVEVRLETLRERVRQIEIEKREGK